MRRASEENGSWKMICICGRYGRSSLLPRCVMSRPSSRMVPAVGSIRRSTVRPTVDLPQPDSPTRPSVSRGAIENETPSTAKTLPPARRRKPWWMAKWVLRSRTSSTGGGASGATLGALVVVATSVIAGSKNLARAPARRPMARPLLLIRWERRAATVLREGAARREHAADRQVAQRRHHAGNFLQPPGRGVVVAQHDGEARDRGHQPARVGMLRVGKE